MCEFCHKHGEGKKWYLVMRNYSRELWEQKGRKEFAEYFWSQFEDYIKQIFIEHKACFFEGKTVVAVERKDGKIMVIFSDGSDLDAVILINSMGTKSRSSFLAGNGVRIHNGILVDRRMIV